MASCQWNDRTLPPHTPRLQRLMGPSADQPNPAGIQIGGRRLETLAGRISTRSLNANFYKWSFWPPGGDQLFASFGFLCRNLQLFVNQAGLGTNMNGTQYVNRVGQGWPQNSCEEKSPTEMLWRQCKSTCAGYISSFSAKGLFQWAMKSFGILTDTLSLVSGCLYNSWIMCILNYYNLNFLRYWSFPVAQ